VARGRIGWGLVEGLPAGIQIVSRRFREDDGADALGAGTTAAVNQFRSRTHFTEGRPIGASRGRMADVASPSVA
jgi:hypothetical protein